MKIIGGRLKGRNFYMPAGLRPTQNVIREAVFNLIGPAIENASFLELFAGSGSVGLEAVSRGAKEVIFIEKDLKSAGVIEENLNILGLQGKDKYSHNISVINGDVFAAIKVMAKQGKKFDYIFLDPPYQAGLVKKTLKTLGAYDILQPNCLVVVEYSKHESADDENEGFFLLKERKYGKSFLAVFERRYEDPKASL